MNSEYLLNPRTFYIHLKIKALKYFITLTIGFLFTFYLHAQDAEIQVIERSMSQGTQHGIEISIPEATAKVAQAQWMKFVKQYKGKTKYNKKTMEIKSDNVKIPEISSNTIDIYTTIAEYKGDNKVVASFWFDLGGSYLNAEVNPERIRTAENLVNTYAKQVMVTMAEMALADEEKSLKALNSDLKTLEKQNEKFHDKIAEAKKLIEEINANIETNLVSQENKQAEILDQKNIVNAAQSKVASIKM